jgi:pSer/pThr/pTyr-binding forkhead associated (FHA) protein
MDIMYSSYPFLEVQEPDGNQYTLRHDDNLERNTITIGRNPECNINLSYDSVARLHCMIQAEGDRWWLIGCGLNGTFVRQGGGDSKIYVQNERTLLQDGDVVLIEASATAFWQFTFRNPNVTEQGGQPVAD